MSALRAAPTPPVVLTVTAGGPSFSARLPQRPGGWPHESRPGVAVTPESGWGWAVVDPACPGLLAASWAGAADAILCRPPGCPHNLVAELWPHWCRLVENLARRRPRDMEHWAADIAAAGTARNDRGVSAVFAQWAADCPHDSGHTVPAGAEPWLRRLFVWFPVAGGDARPGLAEARWVHWPPVGPPALAVRLVTA